MKQKLSTLFLVSAFAMSLQAQKVTVEIDYGGNKPAETHQTDWYEGMTAQTALQHFATIETYPVKNYIFITTINGIKNDRGVKAWYYTVNGESTGKLAFRYNLQPGDTLRWIYKKDVCSKPQKKQ
ncbi:DUF4430 domain-containing protein [Limibacterium fermenti]|uniref:DUF4430 domain-containing protein n=1 Tax=Limibacterium fermenti TaxID=3229863 RepID=UPI000E8BB146|nr:hypothetical protein [Porphyromonadaceae bacterium]HBX44492.1 hypothetical protein [Porphyromonadaceae bacterium]